MRRRGQACLVEELFDGGEIWFVVGNKLFNKLTLVIDADECSLQGDAVLLPQGLVGVVVNLDDRYHRWDGGSLDTCLERATLWAPWRMKKSIFVPSVSPITDDEYGTYRPVVAVDDWRGVWLVAGVWVAAGMGCGSGVRGLAT